MKNVSRKCFKNVFFSFENRNKKDFFLFVFTKVLVVR